MNHSIPLKALDKLITETTLSRSLSHQAKTFGHLMLPSFMSSILLLGSLIFAVMLALFLRRRLRARRRTSAPGTPRGNTPGVTEATDPEARRLVPNTGITTPIVRSFHPFPAEPPPVRTETPPTGTRRVTTTTRLVARGGPLSLPSEPRHTN